MCICSWFKTKSAPSPIDLPNTPAWFKIAWEELGTTEVLGIGNNPRILEYHQTTSLKAGSDSTSWCSSFINWCFKEAGIKGTDSALARSWLRWGKSLDEPKVGCVVVLWRGSITGWKGHIGFYLRESKTHVFLLGGNTSDKVGVAKYPKKRILDFRWPA